MKKLLISITIFISTLFTLEANELSPKDFGLNSTSEIFEFSNALTHYGYSMVLVHGEAPFYDDFNHKVEQFLGYMFAIPELKPYAEFFNSAYKSGLNQASASLEPSIISFSNTQIQQNILSAEKQISDFKQNYSHIILTFLKINPIPEDLFEF